MKSFPSVVLNVMLFVVDWLFVCFEEENTIPRGGKVCACRSPQWWRIPTAKYNFNCMPSLFSFCRISCQSRARARACLVFQIFAVTVWHSVESYRAMPSPSNAWPLVDEWSFRCVEFEKQSRPLSDTAPVIVATTIRTHSFFITLQIDLCEGSIYLHYQSHLVSLPPKETS